MENKKLPEVDNLMDVRTNRPSTSRFYFLLGFFGYFAFFVAVCYSLWTHRYNDAGKHVKVQSSSLYNPVYKGYGQ